MNSTHTRDNKIPFMIVLITVVLSFCVLIGTMAAWLIKIYNYNSADNQIGAVEVELYANGTKVVGRYEEVSGVSHWVCSTPYEITGTSVIRNNINLTMRNNGTVDALVRATITIYYLDSNNNKVVLLVSDNATANNEVELDTTDWVYDFADGNNVAGGYMFYNAKLSPYIYKEITTSQPGGNISETVVPGNEKKLLNSIMLNSTLATTTIYVDVTLDAIAYSGNIYKKIKAGEIDLDDLDEAKYGALPFGTPETLPYTEPNKWTAWE